MTKEAIIRLYEPYPNKAEISVIGKMMDEYAKQQAIAFVKFCFEKEKISSDFDAKDSVYFDGNYFNDPTFVDSALKLYNQFIEQQNKDNGNKGEG